MGTIDLEFQYGNFPKAFIAEDAPWDDAPYGPTFVTTTGPEEHFGTLAIALQPNGYISIVADGVQCVYTLDDETIDAFHRWLNRHHPLPEETP